MSLFDRLSKSRLVTADEAISGRAVRPFKLAGVHTVLGTPIDAPAPPGHEEIVLGMGCFWGAEELFWQLPGVWTTAAGYAGGHTPNPTYEEVCSGATAHAEVVRVVFDPAVVSLADVLKVFWEHHDPTQGMQQGNDVGSQYRSAIYVTSPAQLDAALASRAAYARSIDAAGYGSITTEIVPLGDFYYAEDYHQQYLHKNPNGYRCHANTGVPFPSKV
ncbi:MAG TPA: peptide-methionine (S)-S-oxide reductase MsrA [Jiangellaceae bacterium]|nr:peptide-methionine (S)-S-oxide reductase MsrA [Jiangellaceae bacterium]